MKIWLIAAIIAIATQCQAATLYPCDVTPLPKLCWGQKRMSAAYSGSAVTVYNPVSTASQAIGFVGDVLDTTTLDALLAGTTGIVTRWHGQKNAIPLDQVVGQAPSIGTLTTGNARSIIFQGESQSGALFGMLAGDITPQGITAKDFSIIAVVQPSSSMAVEQAAAPGVTSLALLDMVSAAPVTLNGVVTSSSAIVTGLSSTSLLAAGDIVGAGGVGIADGSSILSIDSGTQITLSANALSNVTGALLMVSRTGTTRFTISGNLSSGSALVTSIPSTSALQVGDLIEAHGLTISPGTKITSVDSGTQVTLDTAVNLTGTAALKFSRPVARVFNNANSAVRGGWQVNDGTFDFTAPSSFVQVNPTVVGITSDSTGVKLWQNGQVRATASRSALTRTAAYLYLGKLATAGPGGFAQGFGGSISALMVYNVGLTQVQYAAVASALYGHFGITRSVSTFSTNLVTITGDSIAAGYMTLGIYGYAHYLQAGVTQPTRFLNFAIPGNTCSQNPAGGPSYSNQTGQFPLAIAPQLSATSANKGRIVIIHGGGNDTGFGPTGRVGTTNGTNVIAVADTTSLTVGDYVYASNIATLSTITNIVANTSVTISGTTSGSATVFLGFTYAATSPTAIYNCIQALATAALAAGATKVIVSTILPRVVDYQPWLDALNVLIRAGVTGATVVDCAAFPGLDTNPGPSYADPSHLPALGHQQMATCLQPAVNSGLSP